MALIAQVWVYPCTRILAEDSATSLLFLLLFCPPVVPDTLHSGQGGALNAPKASSANCWTFCFVARYRLVHVTVRFQRQRLAQK